MKQLALLVILMLPAHAVIGQTTEHVLVGPGISSCGKYLEYAKLDERSSIFVTWAQGFLSGVNVADHNSGKPWIYMPDAETIKAYLDKHCAEKPLSTPGEGVALMYYELRQRQKPSDSKVIPQAHKNLPRPTPLRGAARLNLGVRPLTNHVAI